MSTKLTVSFIIVILVIGGMLYLYRPAKAPTDGVVEQTSQNTYGAPASQISAPVFTVEITKSGFVPSALTIKKGTSVTFVNKDVVAHWPASGPHPAHTCYPGFDALASVAPGTSYTHVFDLAKTCPFHDHLNPSVSNLYGFVTVTE